MVNDIKNVIKCILNLPSHHEMTIFGLKIVSQNLDKHSFHYNTFQKMC
jgi:hypothetical protein